MGCEIGLRSSAHDPLFMGYCAALAAGLIKSTAAWPNSGEEAMGIGDIATALGGVAALVAAGTFIGKLVLEKFADGALRRFEHSMTIATEVHKAELARQADAFKSFVAFSAAIDTDLRQRRVEV